MKQAIATKRTVGNGHKVCKNCGMRDSVSKGLLKKGLNAKGLCPVCAGESKQQIDKRISVYNKRLGLNIGGREYSPHEKGERNPSVMYQVVGGSGRVVFTVGNLKAAREYARLHPAYKVRKVVKAKSNPKPATKAAITRAARKAGNGTVADFKRYTKIKLQDLARKFQGEANGLKHRLLESDYTPQDKYRLGYLVQMKIRGKQNGKSVTIPITFGGDSMLSADRRENLHVSGKDAKITLPNGIKRPTQGQLKYLGELVQIDYVTAKKHIENGETVRFFHKLGEVTKEVPNLFIDHEGFPIVQGGGYEIWDVGIVN